MGVIKNVHKVLAKIKPKFLINPPISSPKRVPISAKNNKQNPEAKLINPINKIGVSVKSPILSLFIENK